METQGSGQYDGFMAIRAFYSYAHLDNTNSDGFVVNLAFSLRSAYQLLSGEPLDIFIDRDESKGLKWGQEWRKAIDSKLEDASFFIPVLSPTYLLRPECRREFDEFFVAARAGNQQRLIIPILFAPLLDNLAADDELATNARALQWMDWSETRLASADSAEYRRLIHRMAKHILDIQNELDSSIKVASATPPTANDSLAPTSLEAAGSLDRISDAERRIGDIHVYLDTIARVLTSVGEAFHATAPVAAGATSFGQRLSIVTALAKVLEPLAEEYYGAVKSFVENINEADPGVRELMQAAMDHAALLQDQSINAPEREKLVEFLGTMFGLSRVSIQSIQSSEGFLGEIPKIENMARVLRPPLRKLRLGTAMLISTRSVFQGWLEFETKSGVA
jgi:hypothetical protein